MYHTKSRTLFMLLTLVLSTIFFGACNESNESDCPNGTSGCPCYDDGICNNGLECSNGVCINSSTDGDDSEQDESENIHCFDHTDCPIGYSCISSMEVCGTDTNAFACDIDLDCINGYECYVNSDNVGKCIPKTGDTDGDEVDGDTTDGDTTDGDTTDGDTTDSDTTDGDTTDGDTTDGDTTDGDTTDGDTTDGDTTDGDTTDGDTVDGDEVDGDVNVDGDDAEEDNVVCPEGSEDCPCYGNNTCDQGLECTNDVCTVIVCDEGTEGCPCYGNDTCDGTLQCENGVCVPVTVDGDSQFCPDGTENCPCYGNGTCNSGLECTDNVCTEIVCDEGTEGCPCYGNNTCNGDLECENDVCVPANVDGDNVDGDEEVADGDEDEEIVPECSGACDNSFQLTCTDEDTLCTCNETTLEQEEVSCNTICIDAGYDGSSGCETNASTGTDVCMCFEQECASDDDCVALGKDICIVNGDNSFCADGCPMNTCSATVGCMDVGIGEDCGICFDFASANSCSTNGEACETDGICTDLCGVFPAAPKCMATCEAAPNTCAANETCMPIATDDQGTIGAGACIAYSDLNCETCGEQTIDGDVDGDEDEETSVCSGSCDSNFQLVCTGDNTLCTCNETTLEQEEVNCNTICVDAGYDGSTGCETNSSTGTDVCMCIEEGCQSDADCVAEGKDLCITMGDNSFCVDECAMNTCSATVGCMDAGLGDDCGVCFDLKNANSCTGDGTTCETDGICTELCGVYPGEPVCLTTCEAAPSTCQADETCLPLATDADGTIGTGACIEFSDLNCATCGETADNPCNPNPCTEQNKTVCTVSGEFGVCSCNPGYQDDGNGGCEQVAGQTTQAKACDTVPADFFSTPLTNFCVEIGAVNLQTTAEACGDCETVVAGVATTLTMTNCAGAELGGGPLDALSATSHYIYVLAENSAGDGAELVVLTISDLTQFTCTDVTYADVVATLQQKYGAKLVAKFPLNYK